MGGDRRTRVSEADFLGIIGRYPNVPKSNRLHLDIFRFFFINVGRFYIFL